MAGKWAGGGTVTLDDGSNERIRCRATYRCRRAEDGHEPDLRQRRLQVQSARPASSTRAARCPDSGAKPAAASPAAFPGRGGGGNFQVTAVTAGFNANISLATTGNKQTVAIRADSQFRAANISLSK